MVYPSQVLLKVSASSHVKLQELDFVGPFNQAAVDAEIKLGIIKSSGNVNNIYLNE